MSILKPDAVDYSNQIINTKAERARLRAIAEDLFQKVIKARDGYKCRKCGNNIGQLDVSHVISRGNIKVQFDLRNAFLLCHFKCHLNWAHRNIKEFIVWVKKQLGEDTYYSLVQEANKPWKETVYFYENKIEELKEELKRLGVM